MPRERLIVGTKVRDICYLPAYDRRICADIAVITREQLRRLLVAYYGASFWRGAAQGFAVTRRTVERWLAGSSGIPRLLPLRMLERLPHRRYMLEVQHRAMLERLELEHRARLGELVECEQLLKGLVARSRSQSTKAAK